MKLPNKNLGRVLAALGLAGTVLACSLSAAPATEVASMPTIVAGTLQALTTPTTAAATQASEPTQPSGIQVTFGNASLTIPTGLASGAQSETVPAVNDQSGAPWDVAPAFTRFTLQAYPLQGEFFEPQIMIYPAQDYASASNGAALSIQRLQAILASPSGSLSNDLLPRLPFANAEQIIGAQPKIIAFNGGQGVRVLAEYSQGYESVNNHEIFYHFQGLTSDGKFYLVAVLPINAAFLAASMEPTAAVPPGGIPFPTDIGDGTPMKNYYQAVTDKLNGTAPDAFQPALTALDALMQSVKISP